MIYTKTDPLEFAVNKDAVETKEQQLPEVLKNNKDGIEVYLRGDNYIYKLDENDNIKILKNGKEFVMDENTRLKLEKRLKAGQYRFVNEQHKEEKEAEKQTIERTNEQLQPGTNSQEEKPAEKKDKNENDKVQRTEQQRLLRQQETERQAALQKKEREKKEKEKAEKKADREESRDAAVLTGGAVVAGAAYLKTIEQQEAKERLAWDGRTEKYWETKETTLDIEDAITQNAPSSLSLNNGLSISCDQKGTIDYSFKGKAITRGDAIGIAMCMNNFKTEVGSKITGIYNNVPALDVAVSKFTSKGAR